MVLIIIDAVYDECIHNMEYVQATKNNMQF